MIDGRLILNCKFNSSPQKIVIFNILIAFPFTTLLLKIGQRLKDGDWFLVSDQEKAGAASGPVPAGRAQVSASPPQNGAAAGLLPGGRGRSLRPPPRPAPRPLPWTPARAQGSLGFSRVLSL